MGIINKIRRSRVPGSGYLVQTTETPTNQLQAQAQTGPSVVTVEQRLLLATDTSTNQCQTQRGQPLLEKRLEESFMQVLMDATNNFSEDHMMGTNGTAYHGKLDDGQEIFIEREKIIPADDDADVNSFLNGLNSISLLNQHMHLVHLLGFYEDHEERILVYEFMKNRSLYDHLHNHNRYRYRNQQPQIQSTSPLFSSWAARLKVALDAARAIEFLHQNSIMHGDIKSSNIFLDATWTAKVSYFAQSLSTRRRSPPHSHLPLWVVGTMGTIDPEYYRLRQLTSKSDVYCFGVLLLELLSGLKAIHKNENGIPRHVVDYMVPYIVQDEIHKVLDPKVPPPTPFEVEAVAYVGYMAADCVVLEGRDRPTMLEIVGYLERAVAAAAQPMQNNLVVVHRVFDLAVRLPLG